MRNIHFVREPGFTYDLFFYFVLYFNKDYCLTNYINYNKSAQDTDHINEVLATAGEVPDELELFFHLRDDERCLMMQAFLYPYKNSYITTYDLTVVQEALGDVPRLVALAVDFYFPGKRELKDALPTSTQISAWIRESPYSGGLKSSLYAFFFEPAIVARLLSKELFAKALIASRQYEKSDALLTDREQRFDLEALQERLRDCGNLSFNLDFPDVYVSFCWFAKNPIYGEFFDEYAVLILGYDYYDMAEYLCSRRQLPELDVFCNALSEKNRVKILDLIAQREEITIQDIEQELSLTGTNAYYHLNLMIKANILRSRNRGRTVLYSLNRRYFNAVGNLLKQYESQEENQ